MNCTRTALALALSLCWAQEGVGQSVYRCEKDGQTVFSQQPCAENAEKIEVQESYSPDGSKKHTGIDFRRTSCRSGRTGTTQAVVELANMTDQIKAGELRIQFIRKGSIVEVARNQFVLAPWGSESFDRLGPIGRPVDSCEYRITVEP